MRSVYKTFIAITTIITLIVIAINTFAITDTFAAIPQPNAPNKDRNNSPNALRDITKRTVNKIELSTLLNPLPGTAEGISAYTEFTTDSIVFTGTSGIYAQDNSNLFWDNTNNRLGIGTTTPAAKVDIAAGSTSYAPLKIASGTLLSSTQSGAIEYDGSFLYFTDSGAYRQALAKSAYGEMYLDNATGLTVVVTTAGTYYRLNSSATVSLQTGTSKYVTYDVSNGHGEIIIQAGGAGVYSAHYTVSFASSAPNIEGISYIFINEIPQANCSTQTSVAVASKTGNTSKHCHITLAVGDKVSFRATTDTNGVTFTTKKLNIAIERI